RGVLLERFERLKRRLEAEGLFDARRKKPIPLLPRRIGIVTSPTGAALRDIFNVLGRRFSGLGVVISPARVQGEGAAEEIAEGVRRLNAYGEVDVIIVTRGGGSLDDLWCFNEEPVARAIAASRIPVISAVGHQIDYTIADFAADLRAPTPSAAAELVVGRKAEFRDRIKGLAARMDRSLRLKAAEMRARFNRVASSYVFREPGHLVGRCRESVSHCRELCLLRLKGDLDDRRRRVDDLESALLHMLELRSRAIRQRVDGLGSRLASLNPSAVLARGYSMTLDRSGRALLSAAGVRPGEEIVTVLYRGRLKSVVRAAMGKATPSRQEEPDEDRSGG
ncbi:MAG TPA: exodeoxyribonuclease VII large subunit, partial [Kiritimatiellae bacterium]|nr:exodeoxyribonuclease VII large subunit [Kiritimatiellia bacterium]